MSRKMIRSIIVLMSIAMIGLVGFQAYWINNAIDVNNVKFRQNVHDALNSVVSHLEKKEVYSVASKQINNRPLNQRIFQIDTNLFWANQGRQNRIKGNYSSELNPQQRNSFDWESDFIFEDSLSFGEYRYYLQYNRVSNSQKPNQI